MAETIKIPGIKQPLPKWGVLAAAGATGVVIIVWYRNRNNAAANSAAAAAADTTGLSSGGLPADSGLLSGDTSSAYPWDGSYGNPSDPYSLDTSTGQTYGDEGYLGGYGAGGSISGSGVPGPPFSSNAAWSAYALQQLETAGFSGYNVSVALGLYLDGKVLDGQQQNIIYAAIAQAGAVPVRGPGGYPPQLRTKNDQGTGHKGGKQFAENPVKGLHAKTVSAGTVITNQSTGPGRKGKPAKEDIEISWDKSAHATGYQVSVKNVSAHRTALAPVTTVKTSYKVRGLDRGADLEVTVLAKPAEKGARPAKTQVKT